MNNETSKRVFLIVATLGAFLIIKEDRRLL